MSAHGFNSAILFGSCGAALVGIGLYRVAVHSQVLRRIVGVNLLGGGIFLVYGAAARRGAAAGLSGDPIPQALVITGLVVAFAATALAVALLRRLFDLTGRVTLDAEPQPGPPRSEP